MSDSRSEMSTAEACVVGLTLVAVMVLLWFWLSPLLTRGIYHPKAPEDLQQVHMIVLSMFCYANDHGNAYPTGKSSTEVFQKLIDDKYISDPTIFYSRLARIPGKFKATSSKLVPANVCWDVTVSVDDTDPDALPMVFWTGFRINYAPGGAAIPLSSSLGSRDGLFVAFKNNGSKFMSGDRAAGGIVHDIIPSTIVYPAGKKYRQLTPDGPLTP